MTRTLTIATGTSRNDKKWKNRQIEWSDLVDQLSDSAETKETLAEYNRKSKSERDNIKDIGGFIGGGLKGAQRINDNFAFKDLLTLDVDNAVQGFWDDLTMFNDFSCCIYSTHSHSDEKPRLRLIAPLSRQCSADEYAAVARKVCEDCGILEQVDPASFRAVQLMYWPSHPKDVTPVFEHQDGSWLDVDAVLAEYVNWQDISNWPLTPNEKQAFSNTKVKAADPLQKEGLIGAFCRTYSVPEAIEKFIPEVYTPGSSPERYTYAAGTSANGLVIYQDGALAYSNHATDPAAGHALNAFDIVRIHRFGDEDRNRDMDTPVNKLPSYKSMEELAYSDDQTAATLNMEQIRSAQEAFAGINENVDADSYDWAGELERDKRGIRPTINNYYKIISSDPMINTGTARYNELTEGLEVAGELPWDASGEVRSWSDADDAALYMYIEKIYKIQSRQNCNDALLVYAKERRYHPIRDYLDGLEWDGTERLDTLLIDYLGAEDTPYTRAVTRKTVCAAVKRIYEPGCKFDQMLILTGPQGCGKSTLARKLGKSWFSDTVDTAGDTRSKDRFDQIFGVWIGEDSELSKWTKADVSASKRFVASSVDVYRGAYDRRTTEHKRQCIFIGTTNDKTPLHDKTGNRRYWVVDTRMQSDLQLNVWDDLTEDVVDQVYAEAKYRLKHGEKLYLDDRRIADAALDVQADHAEEDAWVSMIENFLEMDLPSKWYDWGTEQRIDYLYGDQFHSVDYQDDGTPFRRQHVSRMEIMRECLQLPVSKCGSSAEARRVTQIMEHEITGWVNAGRNTQVIINPYGRQRVYVRKEK